MIESLSYVGTFISFKNEGKTIVGKVIAEMDTSCGTCVAVENAHMVYHVVLGDHRNTCTFSLHIGYDVKSTEKAIQIMGYTK